jgi:hypothetical protein
MPKQPTCTPENPWCLREETPPNSRDVFRQHITPELITRIGACGVGCRGIIALEFRRNNMCGMPGAILDDQAWEGASRERMIPYGEALATAHAIIVDGADPAEYIQNPPGNLSPKAKVDYD